MAVAFINAFIEFYQLQKSEAILESFLAMIPPTCRVIRNGTLKSVGAEGLVRGDVVLVVSLVVLLSALYRPADSSHYFQQ